MMNQTILPAISDYKALEKFIATKLEYCVVMNFPLIQLHRVCKLLKENEKKCIVHLDLVKGLSSNEYGAEYLIDAFKVDGVISTHPSVIEISKKKKVIAIQRIFIIDSLSLNRSIEIAKKCDPDYIELLPGYSYEVEKRIHEQISTPLIGGGLISSHEMVNKCLAGGLVAVTTSEAELWI
jgi:glycerol uptake operon antiterminator